MPGKCQSVIGVNDFCGSVLLGIEMRRYLLRLGLLFIGAAVFLAGTADYSSAATPGGTIRVMRSVKFDGIYPCPGQSGGWGHFNNLMITVSPNGAFTAQGSYYIVGGRAMSATEHGWFRGLKEFSVSGQVNGGRINFSVPNVINPEDESFANYHIETKGSFCSADSKTLAYDEIGAFTVPEAFVTFSIPVTGFGFRASKTGTWNEPGIKADSVVVEDVAEPIYDGHSLEGELPDQTRYAINLDVTCRADVGTMSEKYALIGFEGQGKIDGKGVVDVAYDILDRKYRLKRNLLWSDTVSSGHIEFEPPVLIFEFDQDYANDRYTASVASFIISEAIEVPLDGDHHIIKDVTLKSGAQCNYTLDIEKEGVGAGLTAKADRDIVLPVPTGAPVSKGTRKDIVEIEGGPEYNTLRFEIPDTPANKAALKADKLELRARILSQSGEGRLYPTRDGMTGFVLGKGSHELVWRGAQIKLGEEQTFYYRWSGDPPKKLHREVIQVEATREGKSASKKLDFEVGIDLEVTGVDFSPPRPGQTDREEALTVYIKDKFREDVSPSETLSKLKLAPVLLLRQCEFKPPPIDGVLSLFGFGQGRYKVEEPRDYLQPSMVARNLYAWPVTKDEDGDIIGGEGSANRPAIRFRALGEHGFVVDVVGYVKGPASTPQSTIDGSLMLLKDPTAADFNQSYKGSHCPKALRYFSGGFGFSVEDRTFKASVTSVNPTDRIFNAVTTCTMAAIGVAAEIAAWPTLPLAAILAVPVIYNVGKCVWQAGYAVAGLPQLLLRDGGGSPLVAGLVAKQLVEAEPPETSEEEVASRLQSVLATGDDLEVVLVSKSGLTDVTAESSADGRLEMGAGLLTVEAIPPEASSKDASKSAGGGGARRLQDSERFVIVPARRGESVRLQIKGTGKGGSVWAVRKGKLTRLSYPDSTWSSSIELGADGAIAHVGGDELQTSEVAPVAPEVPPTPSAPEQPTLPKPPPPTPSVEPPKPPVEPEVGGQCSYDSYPGSCTITAVTATTASAAQAKVGGGAGYEGREVKFVFTSRAPISSAQGREAMRGQHELRLKNSWYPGPRFIEKYAIAPGKSFSCTMRVPTAGGCTPILFDVPAIDTGDTSERR